MTRSEMYAMGTLAVYDHFHVPGCHTCADRWTEIRYAESLGVESLPVDTLSINPANYPSDTEAHRLMRGEPASWRNRA